MAVAVPVPMAVLVSMPALVPMGMPTAGVMRATMVRGCP